MPDVYVYVAEELPRPWRTTEFEGTFAVDYSGGTVAGIGILGAQRVDVNGVDILAWGTTLTEVLFLLTQEATVAHRVAAAADVHLGPLGVALEAARAALGMDDGPLVQR